MNTGRRLARRNQSGDLAVITRGVSSRSLGSESRTGRISLKKSSKPREYPRTYKGYAKGTAGLLEGEIVTAREFDQPQKIINFSTAARSIVGGITAFMESSLKITSPGVFSFLNTEKATVKVNNAKLDIYTGKQEDDLDAEEDPEPVLEIPFAELRSIIYRKEGSSTFKLVFNRQDETAKGIVYEPHTLSFTAENGKVACNWVKAICIGCINTGLFLQSILKFFEQNSEKRHEENQEAFLRQIVDLNTLGRGLINEATIAAQRALANFLSENRRDHEAEFWRQRASVSEAKLEEYDAEMHGGLAAVQDYVNLAIRCGRIELDADYTPERRASFTFLPAVFSVRKGANRARATTATKKSRTSRTSRSSTNSSSSEGGSSQAEGGVSSFVGRPGSMRYGFKEEI